MLSHCLAIAFIAVAFGPPMLLILYMPFHFSKVDFELNKSPYKTTWPKTIHFVGPLEPCRFEPYHHYMTAQSTIRKKQIGFFSAASQEELKKRLYQIGGVIS
jgi:hypothetical protein